MHKILYIFISILLLHLTAIAGQAATITVTNKNNSGTGSLRQAIINANNGDKIIFATGLSGTIQLASTLNIDKNLTINGPGANVLSVDGRDQPTESRVFFVFAGNVVRISDLRISNGFSSGAGGGVGVESGGNLTLNNCLISGNVAESAGGVYGENSSIITITNSTITNNVSFVEGGGVSMRGGTLTMINSTINNNDAPLGGGVSVDNGGAATILNCTITENGNAGGTSGEIGGLRIISGSAVNLKNSIVAMNNISGTSIADVGGTVNSQGNNLIGNNNGAAVSFPAGNPNVNGDFVGTNAMPLNAMLGSLLNNGGTTSTQALMPGSPAIDAGNNTGAPATDQRGAIRPQNTTVDIGAFETGVPITSSGTGTGSNVNTTLGSVSVTFSSVTQAGTTTQIPISPSAAGTLLGGYSFGTGYPAFDITTNALYAAPITVCVQIPGMIDMTTFNTLTLLHYEGGVLVDRTSFRDFATQTICASVMSLSPFAIAENLAPSAANVSVGGRVLTSDGRGISRSRVSITDQNGEIRFATTNSFGFYRFNEIPAGETYVLSVQHKSYQFNSQVLTISEDIRNVDFMALP